MGAGVSNWKLAKAVSQTGQMGVVSGTALDLIMARRLQDGDPGGHMRRALAHFPAQEIAERILDRYFVEGGRKPDESYRAYPMLNLKPSVSHQGMIVAANFAEIWLAKEGHNHPVGLNLLEKIQLPNVMSLYGAMLAGVDYVLMGAGIPREIPGVLDRLSEHQEASLRITVENAPPSEAYHLHFHPAEVIPAGLPTLKRPQFLAIISSVTLGLSLKKKATGRVDGFVIEGPTAGGHNAPPRGPLSLNEIGEPVYGPKDAVNLDQIKALGLPFWVAGGYGDPERLEKLLAMGANGVQVGTMFAFCEESGLSEDCKVKTIEQALRGETGIYTDPLASPTGFPFKVERLPGTLSEQKEYEARPRICDLGYLRHVYRKEDGSLGYRCPSEPIKDYLRKGGKTEDTCGRKCLCNGLMANIGHEQVQKTGYLEKPLLTAGDDISKVVQFVSDAKRTYTAREVVDHLLSRCHAEAK